MSTHSPAQVVVAGALLAALGTAACTGVKAANQTRRVERGNDLVTIGGCNDCHTPLTMGVTQVVESAAARAEDASRRLARQGAPGLCAGATFCHGRPLTSASRHSPAPARAPLG